LKHLGFTATPNRNESPPARGRGLKRLLRERYEHERLSPPARGRGLKR